MELFELDLFLGFYLLSAFLISWALIDISNNKLKFRKKALFILLIALVPVLGSIIYFQLKRRKILQRNYPINI
ncbi:MAG: hypothetical protein CMC96_14875 [Flavobacteriales bacterium]|nr:hypothetical protein [Flavobacteriales bacterium]|tara:strand:+ start:2615 stop:2833 length:219 start_codon:yes stop_codon:yes gene_type:complete